MRAAHYPISVLQSTGSASWWLQSVNDGKRIMSEESLPSSPIRVHPNEEAEISALAYRYYCEEGCPEGKSHEHWVRAEREVRRRVPSANFEPSQAEAPAPSARAENPPLEE